jgi:hypothetical protein
MGTKTGDFAQQASKNRQKIFSYLRLDTKRENNKTNFNL